MEESRSLRTKLRLAEQSQEAARKMEQDYEQVVAMLENEISHLRLQMSKSVSDLRLVLAFAFISAPKITVADLCFWIHNTVSSTCSLCPVAF